MKQFVWCGAQRCEERDGSGSLSNGKQFFPLGQVNFASGTPTNYFYTQDHLGSTREMTKTVSGTTTIEAQWAYDPYGIATKLQGSQDADFQYAGYYMHARSGLNLPVFRAYSSSLGRFINRDPIGEAGGANLYGYVVGNPLMFRDPLGLMDMTISGPLGIFGPGVGNLSDPAFDFAIMNVSLELGTMGMWGVVPAAGTAMGFANILPGSNTPMRSQRGAIGASCPPKQYSVLYSMNLKPTSYPGFDRPEHFREANEALLQAMEADASFASAMTSQGLTLQRTSTGLAPITSPPNFTWHHNVTPGFMELVPTSMHTNPAYRSLFHPGGKGGFALWGK